MSQILLQILEFYCQQGSVYGCANGAAADTFFHIPGAAKARKITFLGNIFTKYVGIRKKKLGGGKDGGRPERAVHPLKMYLFCAFLYTHDFAYGQRH